MRDRMRTVAQRHSACVLSQDGVFDVANLVVVLLVEDVVDRRQAHVFVHATVARDVVIANGVQ